MAECGVEHGSDRVLRDLVLGDTIVLEKGSERERSELIKAYLRRPEVN